MVNKARESKQRCSRGGSIVHTSFGSRIAVLALRSSYGTVRAGRFEMQNTFANTAAKPAVKRLARSAFGLFTRHA